METKKIVILGAGLSGLSCAFFFRKKKIRVSVFEKENEPGGLCRSRYKDGFTFDLSGHLLHFRSQDVFSFVKGLLGDNLIKHTRSAWIYTFDKMIPYPFQVYFRYLPENISQKCLRDLKETRNNGHKEMKVNNFLDWCYYKLGKAITEYFFIPYNEKFWKRPLNKLSYEWAKKVVFVPPRRYIDKVPSANGKMRMGYNACFWYPRKGGIDSLIKALAGSIKDINLNCTAERIDLRKKEVLFSDGRKVKFGMLVSTVPLPEMTKLIPELPFEVKDSLRQLSWVSIYVLNLGVDGEVEPEKHWIYFPGEDTSFFRVGFYHNFSPSSVAGRGSSLYAEVSFCNATRNIREKKRVPSLIKQELTRVGILPVNTNVRVEDLIELKYAYPIYDVNYRRIRDKIINFFRQHNIICCGRFGSWRYMSMEDVILESKHVAEVVSDKV